jgi:hypothetical protein
MLVSFHPTSMLSAPTLWFDFIQEIWYMLGSYKKEENYHALSCYIMVLFHPITLAHVALISSKNCHLLS